MRTKHVALSLLAAGIALASAAAPSTAADYDVPFRYRTSDGSTTSPRYTKPGYRATQHYYMDGQHVAYGFVLIDRSAVNKLPPSDPYLIQGDEIGVDRRNARLVFATSKPKRTRTAFVKKNTPALRAGKEVDIRQETTTTTTTTTTSEQEAAQ